MITVFHVIATAPANYLLLLTDQAIRGFRLDESSVTDVIAPVWIENDAESIDFDEKTGSVFYSNTAGSIVEVKADGSVTTLVQWVKGINRMVVDWTSDLIYYTDKDSHSISVVSRDGLRRAAILSLEDVSVPTDIVLDPENGYDCRHGNLFTYSWILLM